MKTATITLAFMLIGLSGVISISNAESVNSEIKDSVTQVNTKVLGDAPSQAMGNLYAATSQALANAAHNATSEQQQTNVTAQAATAMGISTLYDVDTASTGVADSKILES